MARRIKRLPFNADGPFTARSAFSFNGVRTVPGKPFPHKEAKTRRLRQLYDSRRIGMTPEVVTPKQAAPPETVHWRTLDEKGILDYAFEKTGVRRRNVNIAIDELIKLEACDGGTADRKAS